MVYRPGMRRKEEPPVEIPDALAVRGTEKAIQVKIGDDEDEEPIWIPLSQIDTTSEVKQSGDAGTLIVSHWIAKEKGLI